MQINRIIYVFYIFLWQLVSKSERVNLLIGSTRNNYIRIIWPVQCQNLNKDKVLREKKWQKFMVSWNNPRLLSHYAFEDQIMVSFHCGYPITLQQYHMSRITIDILYLDSILPTKPTMNGMLVLTLLPFQLLFSHPTVWYVYLNFP